MFRPDEIERQFHGISIDSRTIQSGELFVAIRGTQWDGHDFVEEAFRKGAAGAVVERCRAGGASVANTKPIWMVPDTLYALGDLAHSRRKRFSMPLVAITGSSGKTTTKTMLVHILSQEKHRVLFTPGTQNNLIGVPLALLRLGEKDEVAVVEMGTNRWGEIGRLTAIASPTIGLITNIGPAHLEAFGDLSGVFKEKSQLWKGMSPAGTWVVNEDDPLLREAVLPASDRLIRFSADVSGADIQATDIEMRSWGVRATVNGSILLELPFPGRHNLMNALAALACARALGLDLARAAQHLATLPPVPGRLHPKERNGRLVIDDTYNANPASLQAALEVLGGVDCSGRRIAVIGDMLELGSESETFHARAAQWVIRSHVDFLITVGQLSRALLQAARDAGFSSQASAGFDTPEEAGEFLSKVLRPGDAVLLKGSRKIQMEQVLAC